MKALKAILIAIILIVCFTQCHAQTFAEWFRQNATQKKYLVQQILKLQIYLTYTKKGYNIVNKGLSLIGRIKNEDFKLHELFFNDLYQVRPIISNDSKIAGIKEAILLINSYVRKINDLLADNEMILNDNAGYINTQLNNMLAVLEFNVKSLKDVLAVDFFQMTDNNRMERINKIFPSVSEMKDWVVQVYEDCMLLTAQRRKGMLELKYLQQRFPVIEK